MPYQLRRFIYRLAFPLLLIYWFIFRPTYRGALCLVIKDGRILMVRNSYGLRRWTFPGGFVKRREEPLIAAGRELEEETGLIPGALELIGDFRIREFFARDHIYVYRANGYSGQLKPDPGEIQEIAWQPLDALPHKMTKTATYIASHYLQPKP